MVQNVGFESSIVRNCAALSETIVLGNTWQSAIKDSNAAHMSRVSRLDTGMMYVARIAKRVKMREKIFFLSLIPEGIFYEELEECELCKKDVSFFGHLSKMRNGPNISIPI